MKTLTFGMTFVLGAALGQATLASSKDSLHAICVAETNSESACTCYVDIMSEQIGGENISAILMAYEFGLDEYATAQQFGFHDAYVSAKKAAANNCNS